MTISDLTTDLVAIPSHEDETAAGDAIAEWLRETVDDATVRRDDAGNVLARRGEGETSLALVGHHDVVPPDDPQVEDDEYVVEERDGRIYGRGAADMKGAVAAAMHAFRDADPAGELVFASFVGEETGGEGVRAAIDDGFAPDHALVCEGSTGYSAEGVTDVAVAHKGRRAATVIAEGVSAHASETEEGENAIYRACDAISHLRKVDLPAVNVAGERISGSLSVTQIEGGSAWNVVPDRCTATVDERTVPGKRAPIKRVEGVEGVTLRIDQDLPPMECTDESFVNATMTAAISAQSGDPQRVIKPHATDAGWLAGAGTACLVCGPAEPGEAHTADESVSVDVLERCYEIYRAVAESFPA